MPKLNPHTVLQERYPSADFSLYFCHLEACRTVKGLNTHDHHICPRAQFPEYAEGCPENLITLAVEDHQQAHRLLAAAHPAFKHKTPDAWIDAASKGGRIGGSITGPKNKELGRGIFALTLEQHRGNSSKAGRKNVQSGHLDSLRTPEHQAVAGRVGGKITAHIRWHVQRNVVKEGCALCL
jgi:hypothetical protein